MTKKIYTKAEVDIAEIYVEGSFAVRIRKVSNPVTFNSVHSV